MNCAPTAALTGHTNLQQQQPLLGVHPPSTATQAQEVQEPQLWLNLFTRRQADAAHSQCCCTLLHVVSQHVLKQSKPNNAAAGNAFLQASFKDGKLPATAPRQ
jgi:hypothetical protein